MNKTETMSQQIGSYLDASVGKRDAAVSAAVPVEAVTAAQFEGRTRHRQACLIALARIIPDPDNPRKTFGEEELEQLAHSLKTKGQLQPCRVRWDEGRQRYVLMMGNRRFLAAQRAGLPHLECVVHEAALSDEERYELALIENVVRVDLNPIEQAQGFAALLERKKISARQLAQELHLNVSTVSRSLSLLKLPDDVQRAIGGGQIPPGVAREIAKLTDEDKQREMVERYYAEGLTAADTAVAVSKKELKGAAATATRKTITLPGGLKVTLAGKKKLTNVELAAACRQVAEILEADGRGRKKAA